MCFVHAGNLLFRTVIISITLFSSTILFSQKNVLQEILILPDTTCRLDSALFLIEKKTDYFFSFNPRIIPVSRPTQLSSLPETLVQILIKIIDDPEIDYKVIGNQIVIYNPGISVLNDSTLPGWQTARIITLSGQIIDQSTKDPVAFATIALTGSRKGTISNNDGEFIYKFPSENINDSVVIACLGYKLAIFRLSDLITSPLVIRLSPDYIPIQEVIIRKTDPNSLILAAIKQIDQNYITVPYVQTSFYRETIKKGNRFLVISEAILGIYRSGLNDPLKYEQVKVLKGRKNSEIQNNDSVILKLKAGLESSLILDVIRSRPEFLTEEDFPNFAYKMVDIILDENQYTYVIDFRQRENTRPPHFNGQLYIDMNTLAIRAVEFEINPSTIHKATNLLVIKKPRHINVKPVTAKYYVRYSQDKDKFYLAYLRSENEFRIKRDNQLFGNTFQIRSELAITDTDTEDIHKFRSRETINIQNPFVDLLGGFDQSFWEEYNYIKPEETLEEALKRINAMK